MQSTPSSPSGAALVYNHPALSDLIETIDFAAAGEAMRGLAGELAAAMAPALGLGPNALRTLFVKALQQWQIEYGQPADVIASFGLQARIEALRSVCGHLAQLLAPAVEQGLIEPALDAGFKAFERAAAGA